MSWRSKAIGKLKKHGGRLVIRCAQGEEPMLSVLQLHARSSQGICRTLVMKWMCERAHGRDFWDWLAPGGKVSVAAVANVTIQHVNVGMKNVKETYFDNLEHMSEKLRSRRTPGWRDNVGEGAGMGDYLRYYGGLTLTGQLFKKGKATHVVGSIPGKVPEAVGRVVRDEPPPNPALFYAAMSGGGSGHALGVQTKAAGKIQFYDPNLGEAEFDTAGGFADWMTALGKLVYLKYTTLDYEWYNQ